MVDDACLIGDLPYVHSSRRTHKDVYALVVGIKTETHPKPLRLAITDLTTNPNVGKYNAMDLPDGHLDAFQVFQVDAYSERLRDLFLAYRNVFGEDLVAAGAGSDDMVPLAHKLCVVKIRVQLKVWDNILEGRCESIALASESNRHANFTRLLVELKMVYPRLLAENGARFEVLNALLGSPVSLPALLSELAANRTEQPAQSQIKIEAATEAESLQFPDRQTTPPLYSTGSSQDPSDSDGENPSQLVSFDNAPQVYHTARADLPKESVVDPSDDVVRRGATRDEPWTIGKLLASKESEIAGRTFCVSAFVVATIPNDWTLVCGKRYFQARGNRVELGDPFYRLLELIVCEKRPLTPVLDPGPTLSVRLQGDDLESFFSNASVEYNYTHMEGQAATLRYPDEPLQLNLYRKDVKIAHNYSVPMWSARGLYMEDLVR